MSDEKIRNNIKLLSKLLNADKSEQKNYFSESRDAFYNELDKNFRVALEESAVPDKTKIFDEILQIADDTEILGLFPELIGKTFVGIIGFDKDLVTQIIKNISDDNTARTITLDTNLPSILLLGAKDILATNDVGNPITLSKVEYSATNTVLWRNDVDIQKILRFFLIRQPGIFQNIALIYFPAYFNPNSLFGAMILRKLDAAIICTNTPSDKIKNRNLLDAVLNLKNYQVPLNIFGNAEGKFKDIPVVTEDKISSVLAELNVLRRNYLFADSINSRLLEIRRFYEIKIRQLESDKSQIVGDLIKITVDETKNAVKELEFETRKNLSAAENEFEKLRGASTLLLDKAKEYESEMGSRIGDGNILYCAGTHKIWRKIFFQAVDLGDKKLATDCVRNLQRAGDNYVYVYEMILRDLNNEVITYADLERLKNTPDSEFVRKAKIRLKDKLNFSELDYMQIARDINDIETPAEYYFRAKWYEHKGDKNSAVNFYKRALNLGYASAGTRLVELAGKDLKALQSLSDQMVPEANFALAEMSKAERKFAASNRYYKLAAAKKYVPAIKILAKDFFRNLIKNWSPTRTLSYEERRQLEGCVNICEYIISQEPDDTAVKETIGDLYHALGDERRALNWWEQCKTATSYYNIGRLYEYQDGAFSQDLYMAETYFEKAAALGHNKAANELSKVRSWQYDNERKAERKVQKIKKANLKPREVVHETAKSSSSDGWCVITSAACAALHKPDDCAELNTLRAYRDKMKSESPLIAALIEEYYRIAPLLVQKMDLEIDAENIYSSLWKNSISETYRLIQDGDNDNATLLYIEMVQNLCDKYNVNLKEDIKEKIKQFKNNFKEKTK